LSEHVFSQSVKPAETGRPIVEEVSTFLKVTDADQYPDLEFATIDAGKAGDPVDERVAGWLQGITRGFHQGRADEEFTKGWLEHVRADNVVLLGAWSTESRVGPGTIPVATYASFDKTLNVGAGLLPLRMITDVTVAPTHRRRGLLRKLITQDLQDAVDRGVPVAALTVSEGSIYGRFGFGAATHSTSVEVDTTSRFALREPVAASAAEGRVELAEPHDAWPAVSSVFERFHASTRGSVERPEFYRQILTGLFSYQEQGPDKQLRAGIHLDAAGEPDGYALYRHAGYSEDPRTVDVVDLVALTSAAYLRLWRFLADIDLVQRARWTRAPAADPLEWALVEPRVRKVTGTNDSLWVRVLDVPTALAARPWSADGEVVLEVDDAQGHAAGRWLVRTQGGRASVSPADEAGGVRMAADTLGSLYLGGVPVGALRDAGRLAGDDASVATLAAIADGGPTPYCMTGF
jgi:predicted acetyltransferase